MPMRLSDAIANAMLDSGITLDSYILDVYSGAQPATANAAATGTLLASMTLPAPALAAASARAKIKAGTWSDSSANATGTAGYLRIHEPADSGTTGDATKKRIDMDITATGGGGTATIDNVAISITQPVTVNSVSLSL